MADDGAVNPTEPGEGSSPRSTLLVGRVRTVVMDKGGDVKSSKVPDKEPQAANNEQLNQSKESSASSPKADTDRTTPTTPLPQDYSYGPYPNSNTPRQQSGGYYYAGPQMTPEPASPAPQHGGAPYDMASFGLPGAAFAPTTGSPFHGPTNSPVHRGQRGAGGSISPLFPRPEGRSGPPNLPYMASPQLGSYPAAGRVNSQSSEEGWSAGGGADLRNQQSNNYHLSPQISSQSMPMPPYGVPRGQSGGRAYSFEEMMPPLGLEDQANPAYSPYPPSPASPGSSVFLQPAWGYGGPPDPYAAPSSPLQPRPAAGIQLYPGYNGVSGGAGMRGPMGYSQYYPASSPGPPIQTTANNKGPEGANLFIFHIPNHFTNLDMYQLFTPYGNLLSVRIMVEKDTGRSRGFGFVSYDSPESAAVAIKELNGFPIGNKRLKVQHKQIRRQDMHEHEAPTQEHYSGDTANVLPPSELPPSGSTANNMWFDTAAPEGGEGVENKDESALNNLESLQNALPDIPGKVTTVASTEE